MTDALKITLNQLQLHIDKSVDKTLLIFENQWSLDRYKRTLFFEGKKNSVFVEEYFEDKILVTIEDLVWNNGLTGRRFKNYRFMPL